MKNIFRRIPKILRKTQKIIWNTRNPNKILEFEKKILELSNKWI
jgi:hypothetical protein